MIQLPLSLALALFSVHSPGCSAPIHGTLVPTDFVGDRVFARWHLKDRGDLRLYTDTGGGGYLLYGEAIRRFGIAVDTFPGRDRTIMIARIPVALGDLRFPPIPNTDSANVKLLAVDDTPPEEQAPYKWDGRLGGAWFMDKVWTFDYPHRRLYFNGAAPTGPASPACWVPLGFQVDSSGARTAGFARIAARIGGEELQFLLDTGARTELTPKAWPIVAPHGPRYQATSFISADRFDQWHSEHPEWLVVLHAEDGTDSSSMIRVPTIEIGGQQIGPVWFTERPNKSFHDYMSPLMDQPIDGALGGSAWRYGKLIIDYPRARAAVILSPAWPSRLKPRLGPHEAALARCSRSCPQPLVAVRRLRIGRAVTLVTTPTR
jgi:hypothetical protein